jgi:DNA polymerase III delta prime subunit
MNKEVTLGNVYVYSGGEEKFEELRREHETEKVYIFDTLGVEEARLLNSQLTLHRGRSSRWLLVWAKGLTDDGQNALLKAAENISNEQGLIFVLPRSAKLLGTLASRVHIVDPIERDSHYLKSAAENFLAMSIKNRLDYIKKYDNPDLLDSLEELRFQIDPALLRSLLSAKALLRQGSLSSRMALEHIAHLLPERRLGV